jgi:hypothetical protein
MTGSGRYPKRKHNADWLRFVRLVLGSRLARTMDLSTDDTEKAEQHKAATAAAALDRGRCAVGQHSGSQDARSVHGAIDPIARSAAVAVRDAGAASHIRPSGPLQPPRHLLARTKRRPVAVAAWQAPLPPAPIYRVKSGGP